MVHTAFDTSQLITNSPYKIDAVESYGHNLLITSSDGCLRIYSPESIDSEQLDGGYGALELKKEAYVLQKTISGFSKMPVVAIEVVVSRQLLISLSESIAVHRLPNLEIVAVISKGKGANAFSWDDRRGFLCFARQKRVSIFRHDGGRGFVEVREYSVPDSVKSMSWCGENICLGLGNRKEYAILNVTNGTLSDLFSSGRNATPLVVPLPFGELLLGKDKIGVIVDQNGKLVQEGRICWSESPAAVVIQKPYAIALLPRHVEIRSLRFPYPLVQTVVLRDVRRLVQSNNTVIVAQDNDVHGLFLVPIGAQIVQLTASGEFEEALALCKMLPPEDLNLRTAKEQSIHIRYARHLYENGSYEEAMEHFLQSQVEITYVLSLYPSLTFPKSSTAAEREKFLDFIGDTSELSRASSDMSDDFASPASSPLMESDETSGLESKKMSHNTLVALIKFLQRKRFNIIEKATTEVTEEVVSDAVGDHTVSYETSRPNISIKGRLNNPNNSAARDMATILDTALVQALLLTEQSLAAIELLKSLNFCDVGICEEFFLQRNQHLCMLELYKCNTMHRKALQLLLELVEGSKSETHKAEIHQNFKPEMIIEYLKPLCESDPMLALEFSMPVLESCPTQTIELFLSANIPVDLVNSYLKQHAPNLQATYLEQMLAINENGISANLQNEMVQIYFSEVLDWQANLSSGEKWDEKTFSPTRKKLLSALESISGSKAEVLFKQLPQNVLYEEQAILLGKMNQHELALSIYVHKLHVPQLALSYCDRVFNSGLQTHSSRTYSSNIYLTLLQIYLNPQRTTNKFEKRINNLMSSANTSILKVSSWNLIKTKGGRLSKKIAEIEGAVDTRISPSSTDNGKSDGDTDDVVEEEGSTMMLDEVLDLLGQRWDRIHGAHALKLLPKETKLQNLLPFLGPLVKKSSEAYRNFSVIKSLRENENLQVKDELYKLRKTVVKITGESICSLCNKKIGTSVFATYPDGKTIVHFVCFRDSQNMKAISKGTHLRRQ
ncbi:vacuolar sorting protein 39-like [Apium graveolens]|uniref:vacuolar sorting protein 39-like n=1 Tax=Apium graveolens TaxID=4045 RepID=UPI003D794D4B